MTWLALLIASALHAQVPADDARAAFDRFKNLRGTWQSKSTAGWTESAVIDVIARGSVIVERSDFDGEDDDGMMSTIHLDGDRLVLTHYCEAGNQPTLAASKIEDGGRRVTFTFLRGSNMRSRDTGHMDAVVFEFLDADHYRQRWSWYANGKETWFEEVESRRAQ